MQSRKILATTREFSLLSYTSLLGLVLVRRDTLLHKI